MRNRQILFILAFTFIIAIQDISAIQPVLELKGSMPGHITSIVLRAGTNLNSTLTWTSQSASLKVYLYQKGDDLLVGSPQATSSKCTSCSTPTSTLNYKVAKSGVFYLRVLSESALSNQALVSFKLSIRNGILNKVIQDTLYAQPKQSTMQKFNINSIGRYSFSFYGPDDTIIKIYSPSTNIMTGAALYQFPVGARAGKFQATKKGEWTVVLNHGIKSTDDIQKFSFTICDSYLNYVQSSQTCQCSFEQQTYNPVTRQCHLDCNSIVNSNGQNPKDVTQCLCKYDLVFNTDTMKCECIDAFTLIWDQSLLKCVDRCEEGLGNNCKCEAGKVWSTQKNKCVSDCNRYSYLSPNQQYCIINCSLVANSNGLVPNTNNQCYCKQHFVFDSSTVSCRISCSDIAFSSGPVPGTTDQCLCSDNLKFNAKTSMCAIECGALSFTAGQDTPKTCLCAKGYLWNPKTTSCETVCGDGFKTESEECDDGNQVDNDSCSNSCILKGAASSVSVGAIIGILFGIALGALLLRFLFSRFTMKKQQQQQNNGIPVSANSQKDLQVENI